MRLVLITAMLGRASLELRSNEDGRSHLRNQSDFKFSGLAMVLLLKPMLAAHLQAFLGAFSKLRSIAQLFFGSSPALQFCLHGERRAS